MPRSRALLLPAILLLALPAGAQLVLPGKKPQGRQSGRGNLTPHYVCLVCGQRNYGLHDEGRRDDQGNVLGWCGRCHHDTPQRYESGAETGGGLRISGPRSAPATSTGPRPDPGGAPAAGDAAATASSRAAAFVFDEVAKARQVDRSLTMRAVESLLALGEDGITAARERLFGDDPASLLIAAGVLLRSGRPECGDLVIERLHQRLPIAAGEPLLDLVLENDPVRGSPKLLGELLDHPHVGIRVEAQKGLTEIARAARAIGPEAPVAAGATEALVGREPGADLLPVLEPALASKRADARRRAVEVAGGVPGPAALQVLLDHVADPSASVVASTATALAGRDDADLDQRLLGLAFRERWVLRPGACAVLAIVEREDLRLEPILDDSHVEPLLGGLQSSDPFLSGACATALAGIGFRSRDASGTSWLDRDVVDRLVASVSGRQFHSDLPALTRPALRRLELLSGRTFGSDGPRWVEWWVHARDGFYARRAWLDVREEDVPTVVLRYREEGPGGRPLALLGPQSASTGEDEGPGGAAADALRLDEAQARDLVAALEREGVFGPERLPGLRGLRGSDERSLQVVFSGRGKSFTFGPGESEPWFERTVALVRNLADRNRWQLYPDPSRHLSSRDLWAEQSDWWGAEHTELERAVRMKTLVLAALPVLGGTRRDEGIVELGRLYGTAGVADAADFPDLVKLLAEEPYWSERARSLLDLALQAARTERSTGATAGGEGDDAAVTQPAADAPSAAEPPAGAAAPARDVPTERGRVLVDLLAERFPGAPGPVLAEVFRSCGGPFAERMAADPRAPVRAAAARALSEPRAGEPVDAELAETSVETLTRLLGDPQPSVEAAAAEALGRRRVDSARTELLVRARLGLPEVRAAALRAIGRLGGEFVLDALSLGAADSDPAIRLAAAEGLAELADPSSASLLIEMLGEGEGSPLVEPARRGLEALGAKAWVQLLRVVHSPSHSGRREAALLLARQGVPEAASAMIAMLSADPKDARLASELAVLTGVDMRGEADPSGAWWTWWDGVVHDDSTVWFLAALSRAGASPPSREDLAGAGTRAGRLFLLEVLAREEPHLVERARREIWRMSGADPGVPPPRGEARDLWIAHLRESLVGTEAR